MTRSFTAQAVPELQIEAPPALAVIRKRLESIPPQRFADIASLLGIRESGPPIQVQLLSENSELARRVAPWIAGFAVGDSNLVVIFPARSPGYPDRTLEDVLRHEVAHVLISRATAGQPIPRWFNEGVAMAVERERQFQDETQLLYQLVTGGRTDMESTDRLFSGTQSDQVRAYAIAGAFVHEMVQRSGPAVIQDILQRVSHGSAFEAAFADATGQTLSQAQLDFWRTQRIWTSWIPILTSSTLLWSTITILALLAFYMRRRRNRALEKQWDEDEESDQED
jgi:peptidase MA superfamily protein